MAWDVAQPGGGVCKTPIKCDVGRGWQICGVMREFLTGWYGTEQMSAPDLYLRGVVRVAQFWVGGKCGALDALAKVSEVDHRELWLHMHFQN